MTYDLGDPQQTVRLNWFKVDGLPCVERDLAMALADEILRLRSERAADQRSKEEAAACIADLLAQRAERDRKVAEAVMTACANKCNNDESGRDSNGYYSDLIRYHINLAAIIGSVK